jgi:hypothetical protein
MSIRPFRIFRSRDRQDSDDGRNLNCKQIDSAVSVTRSGSWRWQAVPI